MDTSETYIKMCEKAREIQIDKFEGEGLVAGDCIWNGKQHIWLANDFFGLYGLWKSRVPYAYIACMEDTMPVTFTQDNLMGSVTMRKEKYVLTRLAGFGIWLPRQDQLQDMLGQLSTETWAVLQLVDWATEYSHHYQDTVYTEYAIQFKSMEQLWLAFVMKEKYNKIWDGDTWVIDG